MGHIMSMWSLPADDTAPGLARRIVAARLGSDPVAEDACLVASELVANAVVHGLPPITLAMGDGPDLEVSSTIRPGTTGLPEDVESRAAGGRGLRIVAACATSWSWRIGGDRLTVRASFDGDHSGG